MLISLIIFIFSSNMLPFLYFYSIFILSSPNLFNVKIMESIEPYRNEVDYEYKKMEIYYTAFYYYAVIIIFLLGNGIFYS